MKHKLRVTVGLPTYGRDEILLATIKMILAQDYDDLELIVADQTEEHKMSIIETIREIADEDSRLKYFSIQPPNLPAARNFIVAKAEGDIILFIDDDIEIPKNFVSIHAKEHETHPEVAVIAGRVKQKNLPQSNSVFYFDKYGMPQGTFNCPNSMECLTFPGGNHSVKTDVIKKVGGYATIYKKNAVREESDAAHRIKLAGYKMFFSADAAINHLAAPYGGTRIFSHQFDNPRFYINDLMFALRTVERKYLVASMIKRLRIYSGGSVAWPRIKRMIIFSICLMIAVWHNTFSRKNIVATETRRTR